MDHKFQVNSTMIGSRIFSSTAVTLLILSFFSCNQQSHHSDKILQTVENIVEQYPDSALNLLDSIEYPLHLKESQYHKYILLTIQAKDKSYQNISSDTLIFKSKEYFAKIKNMKYAALVSFYSGRVLQEQKANEKAMFAYLEAESYADKLDGEYNLKGLIQTNIGYSYYDELLYDEALSHFQFSREFFHKSQNYKNEASALRNIGNSYLLKENNDSAFYYYHKSLDIVNLSKDSASQVTIRQNLGLTYQKMADYDTANNYFRQALKYTNDSNQQTVINLNIASTLYQTSQKDSALYYLNKSLLLNNSSNYFMNARVNPIDSSIQEMREALPKSSVKETLQVIIRGR